MFDTSVEEETRIQRKRRNPEAAKFDHFSITHMTARKTVHMRLSLASLPSKAVSKKTDIPQLIHYCLASETRASVHRPVA